MSRSLLRSRSTYDTRVDVYGERSALLVLVVWISVLLDNGSVTSRKQYLWDTSFTVYLDYLSSISFYCISVMLLISSTLRAWVLCAMKDFDTLTMVGV